MAELAIAGGTPVRNAPLVRTWPIFDETDVEAVAEVIRGGKWAGNVAPVLRECERELVEFCGVDHAAVLTNGTAALEVALRAVGVGPGDEVILPAYTFIATASAVCMVGGVPVIVDVKPDTGLIDPDCVEAAISARTRAVIPTHIFGRMADMDATIEIASRHGLAVVEDACQAIGAEWRGRKAGAIGNVGALSFQGSKNLNSGEGGAIVTTDEELFLRCYSLINLGRIPEGEFYQHEFIGSNYRMTPMQGALLKSQFARWPEQQRMRETHARYLTELLTDVEGVSVPVDDPRMTRHAYHLFLFRYHREHFGGAPRSAFVKAMAAEGIHLATGYTPMHTSGAFLRFQAFLEQMNFWGGRTIDYQALDLPVCERLCNEEACVFQHGVLLNAKDDLADIATAIRKVRDNPDELAAWVTGTAAQ